MQKKTDVGGSTMQGSRNRGAGGDNCPPIFLVGGGGGGGQCWFCPPNNFDIIYTVSMYCCQNKIKLDSGQIGLRAFFSSVGVSDSHDFQPQTGRYLSNYDMIS